MHRTACRVTEQRTTPQGQARLCAKSSWKLGRQWHHAVLRVSTCRHPPSVAPCADTRALPQTLLVLLTHISATQEMGKGPSSPKAQRLCTLPKWEDVQHLGPSLSRISYDMSRRTLWWNPSATSFTSLFFSGGSAAFIGCNAFSHHLCGLPQSLVSSCTFVFAVHGTPDVCKRTRRFTSIHVQGRARKVATMESAGRRSRGSEWKTARFVWSRTPFLSFRHSFCSSATPVEENIAMWTPLRSVGVENTLCPQVVSGAGKHIQRTILQLGKV